MKQKPIQKREYATESMHVSSTDIGDIIFKLEMRGYSDNEIDKIYADGTTWRVYRRDYENKVDLAYLSNRADLAVTQTLEKQARLDEDKKYLDSLIENHRTLLEGIEESKKSRWTDFLPAGLGALTLFRFVPLAAIVWAPLGLGISYMLWSQRVNSAKDRLGSYLVEQNTLIGEKALEYINNRI